MPPDKGQRELTGVIVVDPDSVNNQDDLDKPSTSAVKNKRKQEQLLMSKCGLPDLETKYVENENDLLKEFLEIVKR